MRLIGYVVLACSFQLAVEARAQPELRRYAPPAEAWTIPYTGILPACGDLSVLAQISSDFADRERSFWASPLAIVGWAEPQETGYRNNGESYIPRRYCAALADFSDGVRRRVGYDLGEQLGFSGVGWGVEWCVAGLDRDFSFAPHCEMTQP